MRGKLLGRHEPNDFAPVQLRPVCIEKNDRRRADYIEPPQQRAIRIVVRGHIGLQQVDRRQCILHRRVGKRIPFHLLQDTHQSA